MAPATLHAAFDLGAGSGRALIGTIGPGRVAFTEVHRFHYTPRLSAGHLRWDTARLFDGLQAGLRLSAEAARKQGGELVSSGVDSWGVDYGLLDAGDRLVEEPVCYRDERTSGWMARVFDRVPREEIFEATGIQFLAFNTLFQLAAHAHEGLPPDAVRLLLMPDLCHHFLCGASASEVTNASTTQLLNARTGAWDDELFARLGLPRQLMPALQPPGSDLGAIRPALRESLDLPPLRIVAPATHDTASAVAGTPLTPGSAYISSGTWSLVGVERSDPILDAAARDANCTNERGVGGTIRFLKNVAGLWILECCRREWQADSDDDLRRLLSGAAAIPGIGGVVFPDDPRFFNPRSMTAELAAALRETGQHPPDDPAALTKVILDSLALRYASVIATLESLTGASITAIHIVGGGCRNAYLNQATADATAKPVLAGPVEAAALGNLLVQSVATGGLASVAEGRLAVEAALPPRRFEPTDERLWRDAMQRYQEIEGR